MVKRFDELESSQVDFSKFGSGTLTLKHILAGESEMNDKGRVFAFNTLPAGAGVKLHPHPDESETYFFLSGTGEFNDNGTLIPVGRGDVAHTPVGSSHGLFNSGDVPLEYICLVLYR